VDANEREARGCGTKPAAAAIEAGQVLEWFEPPLPPGLIVHGVSAPTPPRPLIRVDDLRADNHDNAPGGHRSSDHTSSWDRLIVGRLFGDDVADASASNEDAGTSSSWLVALLLHLAVVASFIWCTRRRWQACLRRRLGDERYETLVHHATAAALATSVVTRRCLDASRMLHRMLSTLSTSPVCSSCTASAISPREEPCDAPPPPPPPAGRSMLTTTRVARRSSARTGSEPASRRQVRYERADACGPRQEDEEDEDEGAEVEDEDEYNDEGMGGDGADGDSTDAVRFPSKRTTLIASPALGPVGGPGAARAHGSEDSGPQPLRFGTRARAHQQASAGGCASEPAAPAPSSSAQKPSPPPADALLFSGRARAGRSTAVPSSHRTNEIAPKKRATDAAATAGLCRTWARPERGLD